MPKYEFVAVDFDGTLCTNAFPEIGEPNPVVIGYVRKLAAEGSKIILYTSRENGTRKLLDEAVAFCKAQEIPIHAVNENPWNPYAATIGLKPSDGRKVYADLYIDDKAINPAGLGWDGLLERKPLKRWIKRADLAELDSISYGAELPADLAASMAEIIKAAGGGAE